MRIAVVNSTNRVCGGAERYLAQVMPLLQAQGHEVALLHEVDGPSDREAIVNGHRVPAWCTSPSGEREALRSLHEWRPEILFVHGLSRHDWLADSVRTYPTAFFCHDYSGMCISGTKTFRAGAIRACGRAFGRACLVHYYPCHCGGWSPVTMIREYERQGERLRLLRLGAAIVTPSEAVRKTLLKNGFNSGQVHAVALPSEPATALPLSHDPPPLPWTILFAGRMEWMKGGEVLLHALPLASRLLRGPLRAIFAGDGACRRQWQKTAELVQSDRIRIEFTGWQTPEALRTLMDRSHLLAVPSLWPEPFGLIGIEAAQRGLPAAAFDVGGISEWLTGGVNGFLAPGSRPAADGLAEAIARCLSDAATYRRLRSGAKETARRFNTASHIRRLTGIFTGMGLRSSP
jgi:glycosyltransferase involved in cell wall biosynthesis